MRYIIAIVAFCVACANHTKQAPMVKLPHSPDWQEVTLDTWKIEIPQTPCACNAATQSSQLNRGGSPELKVQAMDSFQNPQQPPVALVATDSNPDVFIAKLKRDSIYYFRVYSTGPGDRDLGEAFHHDYCGPLRIWTTYGSSSGELTEMRVAVIQVMSNAVSGDRPLMGEYVGEYAPWEHRECFYTIGPPDPFPPYIPDEDE